MKKLLLLAILAIFTSVSLYASTKVYYTKANYVFALTEQGLIDAVKVISSGDEVAFKAMVRAGKISLFKNNLEVYVEESKVSRCLVRLKGTNHKVWTITEAISDKRNY